MKNYIKLIIILLSTTNALAQLPILNTSSLADPNDDLKISKNGNYAQDTANERDQYVGTWEYNQNGILFQIKMEKIDQYLIKVENNDGAVEYYNYCDVITFKYKLVKNGVTIYNNLNQTSFPTDAYVPTAIKQGSDNYLYGGFYDATRNAVPAVSITRLNTIPAKIKFKTYRGSIHLRNPREYYDDGQPVLSIPSEEIEMVKIN